jgi:ATP-dependent DNA helicase RecG
MNMARAEIEALLDRLEDCVAEDLEGQHIDFKEWGRGNSREQLQRVVRAAVCMANGGGGTVVFGVADGVKGRGKAVAGVPHRVSTTPLGRQVYNGTDPKLTPVFEEIEVPEGTGRLIAMHVHPGIPPYTDTAGRGTVRVGRDCLPLTGSLLRQLNEESAASDYTAQTVDAPLPGVFSAVAIEELRAAAERERASEALLKRDDQDLLEAVGATEADKPTRAAILLAGSPAAMRRHVPRCVWTFIRMASNTDYSERVDGNDAIPVAVRRMIARVMAHNPIETVREGVYHFEHRTYPEVALREALLNAFCHSDYRIGSPRLVKQYADRIEITSPGGFLGGITAENILHHRPVTRNPRLVDALVRLRMVNRTNLGTERMYHAFLVEGKRPPVIEDIGGAVRVTFHTSRFSVPFHSFTLAEERQGRSLTVDHLLILNRLSQDREIGLETAARLCQRPEEQALETLGGMEANFGYIERIGPDESWTLTRGLRQRIRDGEEEAEDWAALKGRVLGVMRRCSETGDPPLANLDVRRITGLDRHQVGRLIGELRAEGVVTLSGRGRGARYLYVDPHEPSK